MNSKINIYTTIVQVKKKKKEYWQNPRSASSGFSM